MKWAYSIKNKLAAAAILGTVIGCVLLNNLNEQKNAEDLNENFASLYKDRLLAESYILSMYRNVNAIDKLAASSSNANNADGELLSIVTELNNTIALYRQTWLTPEEEIHFRTLVKLVNEVDANSVALNTPNTERMLEQLDFLSDIQLTEGARLKDDTGKIHSASVTSSQFELALIIIAGVLLQALIFSGRTLRNDKKQNLNLN